MAGPLAPWEQASSPHGGFVVGGPIRGQKSLEPRILAQGFSSVWCPPSVTEKSGKEPGSLAAVGFLCDVSDVTVELGSCVWPCEMGTESECVNLRTGICTEEFSPSAWKSKSFP